MSLWKVLFFVFLVILLALPFAAPPTKPTVRADEIAMQHCTVCDCCDIYCPKSRQEDQ